MTMQTWQVGDLVGTWRIVSIDMRTGRWAGMRRGVAELRCACGKRSRCSLYMLGKRRHRCRSQTPEAIADLSLRTRARAAVSTAVAAGVLVRPEFCSACGARSKRIHGHHRDYQHPLAVQWLCPSCHGAEHMRTRAPDATGAEG